MGVVILHIWALHIPGSGNPTGVDVKSPQDTVPFHPYYTAKDGFGVGIYFILFSIMLFFLPNYLGHPDNYIPANPLSTPAHITPEWYFWPFYAILRAFTVDFILEAKLWGVIAMFAAIGCCSCCPGWTPRPCARPITGRCTGCSSTSGSARCLSWAGAAAPGRRALCDDQPDRDGLLFRLLPDHHPDPVEDREDQAACPIPSRRRCWAKITKRRRWAWRPARPPIRHAADTAPGRGGLSLSRPNKDPTRP
jgi:hypothetical protein